MIYQMQRNRKFLEANRTCIWIFQSFTHDACLLFDFSQPTERIIELLNNNSHGLSPPGGLVSPSGGFLSLLCDQGLHFASIKLCLALGENQDSCRQMSLFVMFRTSIVKFQGEIQISNRNLTVHQQVGIYVCIVVKTLLHYRRRNFFND